MTRKKYVKQLMAMGYSRNEANRSANFARFFTTYEAALEIEKQSMAFQKTAVRLVTSITEPLLCMVTPLAQALERMREAFKGAQVPGALLIAQAAENALMAPDPQWLYQRPTRNDIVDALVYGVDLAAAPDMTAHPGGGGHE